MTELEHFELCCRLPKFSCGLLIRVTPDLAQAYLADVTGLFLIPPELLQKYDATQRGYAALPPNVRAVADVLFPWMLGLRLKYGTACTEMMVCCYPVMNAHARLAGMHQPN